MKNGIEIGQCCGIEPRLAKPKSKCLTTVPLTVNLGQYLVNNQGAFLP